MRDDSDRKRVELKGQTRHTHLDMDGMKIDAEPATLVVCGKVDEGIADEAPRPMDPIMVVMDILWRVEGILKESDTDGNETSWWQLTDSRPSLATLKQVRQVLLKRITRCSRGHRLSTLCRRCTTSGCWYCHVVREEIQFWMCNE